MGPLAGVGDPLVWGTLRPIPPRSAHLWHFRATFSARCCFLYFQRGASGDEVVWPTTRLCKGVNIVSDMGGNVLQKLTEARRFSDCL